MGSFPSRGTSVSLVENRTASAFPHKVCHAAKQPLPSKVLEKKLIPWGEQTERTPPVGPRADGDVDDVLSLNALKGHLHAPGRGVQHPLKQSHVQAPKRNPVSLVTRLQPWAARMKVKF